MRVLVISPLAQPFDGDADSVVAPVYDGHVGILPNHAPFMAPLGRGTVTIRQGDRTSRFEVERGFLQVVANTVRVVAEKVEAAND